MAKSNSGLVGGFGLLAKLTRRKIKSERKAKSAVRLRFSFVRRLFSFSLAVAIKERLLNVVIAQEASSFASAPTTAPTISGVI